MNMEFNYTADEPERFMQAFNRLAASKSGDHDAFQAEVYFKSGLNELPIEAVERAARELQQTPGAFFPDPGTWFRLADKIAAEMAERGAQKDIQALPPSAVVEESEITRTRLARDDFVNRMEQLTGHILPADHPLRSDHIELPIYGCSVCRDIGWVKERETSDRVRHCVCWNSNPVIEQRRATARVKKAASHVG